MAEDRELLTQFVRDESRGALSTLIERYRRMVYGICLRELGDPDDAADATQATFVLLQSSAAKIKRRERVSAWLYSAAKHVCQNARREKIRRQAFEGAPLPEDLNLEPPPHFEGPEPSQVFAYLHRLSDKDRLVLSLRYLNGFSVKEVADSLGISEQAAQMRASRALDRMRDLLQRANIAIAIPNLDHMLSNQLPWDPPEIHVAKNATHRWATRIRPNPGKVLLKMGAFAFTGMLGFILFAPFLILARLGQVSFSPSGIWSVWHMMASGISGSDRVSTHIGRWASSEIGVPRADQKEVEIYRSADGDHYQISIMPLKPDRNSNGAGYSLDRFGNRWRINGVPAVSTGGDHFQWDRGDWTLLADSDRSTERISFHAEGSSLKFTHERGGSMRSLKADQNLNLARTADAQTPSEDR